MEISAYLVIGAGISIVLVVLVWRLASPGAVLPGTVALVRRTRQSIYQDQPGGVYRRTLGTQTRNKRVGFWVRPWTADDSRR